MHFYTKENVKKLVANNNNNMKKGPIFHIFWCTEEIAQQRQQTE